MPAGVTGCYKRGSTMAGNTCKNCGMLKKDCVCATNKRDEVARCPRCSTMTRSKYLKSYAGQELCSNCMTIAQYEPTDREYYKTLANQYQLKLFDIGTHVDAANKLNQPIEDYLEKLPKTPEEFREYFKGSANAGIAETILKRAV